MQYKSVGGSGLHMSTSIGLGMQHSKWGIQFSQIKDIGKVQK